jgi:hypothetical protein
MAAAAIVTNNSSKTNLDPIVSIQFRPAGTAAVVADRTDRSEAALAGPAPSAEPATAIGPAGSDSLDATPAGGRHSWEPECSTGGNGGGGNAFSGAT